MKILPRLPGLIFVLAVVHGLWYAFLIPPGRRRTRLRTSNMRACLPNIGGLCQEQMCLPRWNKKSLIACMPIRHGT
jgi:hypothetical protein